MSWKIFCCQVITKWCGPGEFRDLYYFYFCIEVDIQERNKLRSTSLVRLDMPELFQLRDALKDVKNSV